MNSSRIVIVDDEVDMCWVLERFLRHRGYDVATAGTGEQGLALLQQPGVGLAIIDCKLPDREGLDIAAEVIALNPAVSLILISGFPFAEESALRERIQTLNARFLTKPFEISDLTALVEQVMSSRSDDASRAHADRYAP
jgi:DNA-binding NtrC family response regulator